MKYRAVYENDQGQTFSAPVEKHGDAWIMQTSGGPVPITYNFQDDVGGLLTFVEYREEPDLRLHLSRLPGESSCGALKRAYAEKEIAAQRQQRQALRDQVQNVPVDPAKIAAARAANNYAAEIKRPRGGGTSQATDIPDATQITRGDIETAIRNRS